MILNFLKRQFISRVKDIGENLQKSLKHITKKIKHAGMLRKGSHAKLSYNMPIANAA